MDLKETIANWHLRRAMSTIGTGVLVEDDDMTYSLYRAEVDPELNAVVASWGGEEHYWKLDGEGGVGSFKGGGLVLAYRRLGAVSSIAAAKASAEAHEKAGGPPRFSDDVATDGGDVFPEGVDGDTEVQIPETVAGIRLADVLEFAPHRYDPEDLVKAEQRGYHYALEESAGPSYALVIGVLLLGLFIGAGMVHLTGGGGGNGGSVSPLIAMAELFVG